MSTGGSRVEEHISRCALERVAAKTGYDEPVLDCDTIPPTQAAATQLSRQSSSADKPEGWSDLPVGSRDQVSEGQVDYVRLRTVYKADKERMYRLGGGQMVLFYGQTPQGIRTRDFGSLARFLNMTEVATARHVLALSHAERAELLGNFYDDKGYLESFKLYQQIQSEITEEERELEDIKTNLKAGVASKQRRKQLRQNRHIPDNIDPDLAKSSSAESDSDDMYFPSPSRSSNKSSSPFASPSKSVKSSPKSSSANKKSPVCPKTNSPSTSSLSSSSPSSALCNRIIKPPPDDTYQSTRRPSFVKRNLEQDFQRSNFYSNLLRKKSVREKTSYPEVMSEEENEASGSEDLGLSARAPKPPPDEEYQSLRFREELAEKSSLSWSKTLFVRRKKVAYSSSESEVDESTIRVPKPAPDEVYRSLRSRVNSGDAINKSETASDDEAMKPRVPKPSPDEEYQSLRFRKNLAGPSSKTSKVCGRKAQKAIGTSGSEIEKDESRGRLPKPVLDASSQEESITVNSKVPGFEEVFGSPIDKVSPRKRSPGQRYLPFRKRLNSGEMDYARILGASAPAKKVRGAENENTEGDVTTDTEESDQEDRSYFNTQLQKGLIKKVVKD